MQAAGLSTATRLAEYGLHIYSNIPQLAGKVPLSPAGNPWNLAENKESVYDYRKGACPCGDALFQHDPAAGPLEIDVGGGEGGGEDHPRGCCMTSRPAGSDRQVEEET